MINLIFIHGVNSQTTGYSNWLFKQIKCYYRAILRGRDLKEKVIEERLAQLVQKEFLWADVTTNLTNRYIDLEYELYGGKQGLWNWAARKIDPLALQIMYYIKDKGDKQSGIMSILSRIDESFRSACKDSKDMVIIAHSLGSVIAFDYIFGFRKYCLDSSCNVLAFITMGSPIPIFTSAMGHADSELNLPASVRGWYNILDDDDGVARRCKPFFQNIPLQDIKVRTGIFPLSAHIKYWRNRQTASVITGILDKILG